MRRRVDNPFAEWKGAHERGDREKKGLNDHLMSTFWVDREMTNMRRERDRHTPEEVYQLQLFHSSALRGTALDPLSQDTYGRELLALEQKREQERLEPERRDKKQKGPTLPRLGEQLRRVRQLQYQLAPEKARGKKPMRSKSTVLSAKRDNSKGQDTGASGHLFRQHRNSVVLDAGLVQLLPPLQPTSTVDRFALHVLSGVQRQISWAQPELAAAEKDFLLNWFRSIDTNGNGLLSLSEWMAGLTSAGIGLHVLSAADFSDEDDPGAASKVRELQRHLFVALDSNHSGLVTRAEFVGGCLAAMERMRRTRQEKVEAEARIKARAGKAMSEEIELGFGAAFRGLKGKRDRERAYTVVRDEMNAIDHAVQSAQQREAMVDAALKKTASEPVLGARASAVASAGVLSPLPTGRADDRNSSLGLLAKPIEPVSPVSPARVARAASNPALRCAEPLTEPEPWSPAPKPEFVVREPARFHVEEFRQQLLRVTLFRYGDHFHKGEEVTIPRTATWPQVLYEATKAARPLTGPAGHLYDRDLRPVMCGQLADKEAYVVCGGEICMPDHLPKAFRALTRWAAWDQEKLQRQLEHVQSERALPQAARSLLQPKKQEEARQEAAQAVGPKMTRAEVLSTMSSHAKLMRVQQKRIEVEQRLGQKLSGQRVFPADARGAELGLRPDPR